MASIDGAVIYCRVSSDQSGRARSVSEQEADCRRTCEVEGWPVIDVVVDNDIGASRYSQGTRPGFLRLQALLRRGVVLVSWESSRITRKLGEFAELRDFCADLGVQWFVGGRLYDLNEPNDNYMLGIAAQNAELEVALSRKRIMRAKDRTAATGTHNGWMPFGYVRGPEGWTVDPEAAPIVQEAVRRLLAGDSLRSLAKEFAERGVPAPSRGVGRQGSGWAKIGGKGLRSMVLSPTYAGIHVRRRHDKQTGERVEISRTRGDWEPLITEGEHARLVAMLTDPSRSRTWGSQVTHLLSGIATCEVCGQGVKHSNMKSDLRPRYRCPDSHVKRAADELDRHVESAVVEFFSDHVRAAAAMYGDDKAAREAAELARELRQQLDAEILELTNANISASTRARMAEQMEQSLLPKIEAAEAKARQVGNPVLQKFANGATREVWDSLSILDRREVVRECLKVTILRVKVRNPRRVFDPDTVEIVPKKIISIDSDWWKTD